MYVCMFLCVVVVQRPGSIDNARLLAKDSPTEALPTNFEPQVKEKLLEQFDYTLVPAGVWNSLQRWYGGGPTIARKGNIVDVVSY